MRVRWRSFESEPDVKLNELIKDTACPSSHPLVPKIVFIFGASVKEYLKMIFKKK